MNYINFTMTKTELKTASDAFNYFYPLILFEGEWFDNTKALFNVGFYIEDPMDNAIHAKYRNWNPNYANANGIGICQVIHLLLKYLSLLQYGKI